MRKLFLLPMLLAAFFVNGQTLEVENQSFINSLQEGEINQLQLKEKLAKWKGIIKDIGGYPEMPYNKTKEIIEFEYVKSYKLSKKDIIDRVEEWSAINFGSLKSVLHYKNIESGKIILKGNLEIIIRKDYFGFWGKKKETSDKQRCYMTYVFTVRENRMKLQIVNIKYKFKNPGYELGSVYVPPTEIEYGINELYPIAKFNEIYWKRNLSILKKTNNRIEYLINDLDDYIKNKEKDYDF